MEKMNKKLREELSSLSEHIATNTISKTDMELYKKAVDEKVIVCIVPTCTCTQVNVSTYVCMYVWCVYMCVSSVH